MDNNITIWFIVTLASMPFAFGGFITCWILKLRSKTIKPWLLAITTLGVISFCLSIDIGMRTGSRLEENSREEILAFLNQSNLTVRLFNSEVEDSELFIEELRKLRPLPAHHSHASGDIEVNITGSDSVLKLLTGRDSDRRNEFWIFYPKYRHTELNEVGRIVTDKILK